MEFEVPQVVKLVTSSVVPSAKVAIARTCWVAPMGSVARAGVTEKAVIGMTMKLVALCAVPPAVVTVMGPLVAVGGTVAISVVFVAEATPAGTPLNLT